MGEIILFEDDAYNHKLDYFKNKYPELKDTKVRLTQDLGTSEEESTKGLQLVGLYNKEKNLIVLLECFAVDESCSVLAHEIAHALNWLVNKETGHTPLWKKWCEDIYAKTGVLADRLNSCDLTNASLGDPYSAYSKYCSYTSTYQLEKNNPTKISEGDDDTVIYIDSQV